ncbi:MAG: hypothetical protein NZ561_07780, partial [Phycisphaerae bacterium]|nr:hypothetical protein [Phycisphaerae bacterium]
HPGSRVWLGAQGGRVVTFTSNNDVNPTQFSPAQVFTTTFDQLGTVFTTEFPGYEARTFGSNLVPGTTFGFRLAGPLLKFDAGAIREVSEIFGPPAPGPVPQLAVSFGAQFVVTGSSVQEGFNFFTFNQVGDHEHLSYTLLGNGVQPVNGPNGVYVLPMLLTSPSLARSDWYFILLEKQSAPGELAATRPLAEAMARALPGDANFDGGVDLADFAILAANFNRSGRWWRFGDFDFDGDIDVGDFSQLAANFNRTSSRWGTVPEPAQAGAVALVTLLARRRRDFPPRSAMTD